MHAMAYSVFLGMARGGDFLLSRKHSDASMYKNEPGKRRMAGTDTVAILSDVE